MVVWIVMLGFITITFLAAAQLIGLWRETRCLPELLIAVLILGVGTIALGGGFLIGRVVPPGPVLTIARYIPSLGACLGMIALSIFTWRVYRPESRLALAFAGAFGLGLSTLYAIRILAASTTVLWRSAYSDINSALYVGVMLWSAFEAFLYWLPMRRRLRFGLAEPMVVNRVLLWGTATGTAGVGIAIGTLARIFGGGGSWVLMSYALHGIVSAIAFWLAFRPPLAYERWVTRGTTSIAARTEGVSVAASTTATR